MGRRALVFACVCVLIFGLARAGEARPASEAKVAVAVHPDRPGRAIPRDFPGFSQEALALAWNYFMESVRTMRPSIWS
jgi:hypothetical protein